MTNYNVMEDEDGEFMIIPERFLWYMLECLCIAGLLLERGELEQNPMSDWKPIVHRDLKVSNVFLGLPIEGNFCRYPVPKIGDFGLAAYLTNGELFPQGEFGTPANYPIEHSPDWLRDMNFDPKEWPMTSKANVWGIANIVASLAIRTEGFKELEDLRECQEPTFRQEEKDAYSAELLELLCDCMSFDPKARPDLVQVLSTTLGMNASIRDEPAVSDAWSDCELHRRAIDMVRQFFAPGSN